MNYMMDSNGAYNLDLDSSIVLSENLTVPVMMGLQQGTYCQNKTMSLIESMLMTTF
jgi:hypothetical protein